MFNIDGEYITKHTDGTYTIFSGLPEFGYELLSTIPFAYLLHKQGLLRKTVSGFDTSQLYWFSPKHEEVSGKRSYDNVKKLQSQRFPNSYIHRKQLDWDFFCPPPYKDHFQKLAIKFDKPTLIISNRINREWKGEPVNFLDASTLAEIIRLLHDKYQIVYLETSHFDSRYEDHAEFLSSTRLFSEVDFSGVIKFSDLRSHFPGLSMNELQLRLYAGADKFISQNGGLGILASYFGGENILFTRACHEVNPNINSFYGWYTRLSKANITVCRTEADLFNTVDQRWVREQPLINILVRTSQRPNYFHDCICSIADQSYKNVRILASFDDAESEEYITKFPCVRIPVKKWEGSPLVKPDGDEYGIWFPFNEYFNELLEYVSIGHVIYLDDDDQLLDSNSLQVLVRCLAKESPDTVFWRVKFPSRIVPNDMNWSLKRPICGDISTIGFSHDAEIKPLWEPWKRGDFRVANSIFSRFSKVVWLDEELTGLQRSKQDGYGKRDDKANVSPTSRPFVTVIIPAFNAVDCLEICLDSILQQSRDLIDIEVLVGIDGCKATHGLAKKIWRKYNSAVQFWHSVRNVGPFVIKNSLLKQVQRRNGMVLFFDADDIMPNGLLEKYLDIYKELKRKDESTVGVRLNLVDFPDDPFFNPSSNSSPDWSFLIRSIIQCGVRSEIGEFAQLISAFYSMESRTSRSKLFIRPSVRAAHGVMLIEFAAIEHVGAFNSDRVGMDSDLMHRVSGSGFALATVPTADWFIRRVTKSSLTQSTEFGFESPFRDEVEKRSLNRLKEGLIVADWAKVELTIVL